MSNMTIHWVRLGHPHVFVPKRVTINGVETGDPRFGANLHLPDGVDIAPIKQAIVDARALEWPDPASRPPMVPLSADRTLWNNSLPGYLRIPLVWGPTEYPNDPAATGWVLLTSARASDPPAVVEIVNGVPVRIEDRTRVYPGSEFHASISIFGYNKGAQSKGISCGLNGLQITGREMPRFDSKPTMGQMFSTSGAAPPPPPPLPPGATPAAPSAPPGSAGAPSMGGGGAFD